MKMNPQAVNDFLNIFHARPSRRPLTRSARRQRLPCRAMTTKKPSKGGSTSRSQAPKKGAKAGAARTTKPGKPLPGWAGQVQVTTWAQLALKFVLSHSAVTCVIPGTHRPRAMSDNAGAGFGPMLTGAQREQLIDLIR